MPEPTPPEARDALIGQLAHLLDEVDALGAALTGVPEALLEGRPYAGAHSIKELYGLLAAADGHVHLPFLEQLAAEPAPALDVPDGAALLAEASWNDLPMEEVLGRVREARMRLVDGLRALPPGQWTRTGRLGDAAVDAYGLGRRVAEHDLERMREAAYRLYDSRLLQPPGAAPAH